MASKMGAMTALEALQTVPFFSQLPSADLLDLARFLAPRRFGADQIIFHLGDPGGLLYIITRGKVKIFYPSSEGQEVVLAILGDGEFFGELALFDDMPRSATTETLEATETFTLHRDEFLRFLRANPDCAIKVLASLARRIRHLNAELSDVFFLDLPGRLARKLLVLADAHGEVTPEGIAILLPLTQTDLAEMTGATRVSVNKALSRFRRAQWISIKGRRFIVRDRRGLENLIRLSGGGAL